MTIKRIKLAKALLKFNDYITSDNITITIEGDIAVGKEVFTTDPETGEITVLGNGEYEVEGMVITVEGGIITEIKEKEVEIEEPATTEEPTTEEVVLAEEEAKTDDTTEEQPGDDTEALKEENEALKAEIEALKTKIAELEAELEKAKEPVAESVEDKFKATENKTENKIDFSKYIKSKNK